MNEQIDVSVVLATFHRDATLKRALDSLKNQTFRNFEVVVVDDNNDEKWNSKVSDIIDGFDEIRIIYIKNEKNEGSAKARNLGIEKASGEYVTFLDDDDEYLPEKIERQYKFMKNGGYDFSVTDLYLYNENGKITERRIRSYIKECDIDSLMRYHFLYHLTGTDTLMFKKEYILSVNGFGPVDVGDEFYLMQRAIEKGGKFGYLNRCDVKAYVHYGTGGMSSGNGKIEGENALYQYKCKYLSRFDGKSKRYIKMRHYAVLSFAEFRRRNIGSALVNGICAVFFNPLECVKLLSNRMS